MRSKMSGLGDVQAEYLKKKKQDRTVVVHGYQVLKRTVLDLEDRVREMQTRLLKLEHDR